jgi:acetyl-CoA carboxylase carboxyl transferase subunit beta
MMEGALSLMQLVKPAPSWPGCRMPVPFISILTDPTTGGVTAAMLGDEIWESRSSIGFAGPVIRQTIGRPPRFQRRVFLEHGFDLVVHWGYAADGTNCFHGRRNNP